MPLFDFPVSSEAGGRVSLKLIYVRRLRSQTDPFAFKSRLFSCCPDFFIAGALRPIDGKANLVRGMSHRFARLSSIRSSPDQDADMTYTTVFVVSDDSAIRDSLSELIGSS